MKKSLYIAKQQLTVSIYATKEGESYQLVVTNSAGLYRYVTDHIVRIQKHQLDKILFTIYQQRLLNSNLLTIIDVNTLC